MPWTDKNLVNGCVKGVDLALEPTAFDSSIVIAEPDLYGRLIVFICQATVDTWTLVVNTPDVVIGWATQMAAAYYMSTFQGYHLQPEIPDNPAAILYRRVLDGIESAKFGGTIITDVAGNPISTTGISVSTPRWRFIEYLPTHEGGEIDP